MKEKVKKAKTFHDFYLDAKQGLSPCQQFIADIAVLTCKSKFSVKRWVEGIGTPDALTKQVLAQHFKCNPEDLFPPKQPKQQ